MTSQIEQSNADEVRLPLMRTGLIAVVVCVVLAVIGGLLSIQRDGAMSDGVWTLLATIPGVLIPIGILSILPPKEPAAWGFPVLAGTIIRAMSVLTIGIAVYVLIDPAKYVFFFTLLTVLMITLAVDVASVLSLIQRHAGGIVPQVHAEGVS